MDEDDDIVWGAVVDTGGTAPVILPNHCSGFGKLPATAATG